MFLPLDMSIYTILRINKHNKGEGNKDATEKTADMMSSFPKPDRRLHQKNESVSRLFNIRHTSPH